MGLLIFSRLDLACLVLDFVDSQLVLISQFCREILKLCAFWVGLGLGLGLEANVEVEVEVEVEGKASLAKVL